MAYSAAVAAAIAALFSPVPALAGPHVALPSAPQAPVAPAVPDSGSRPTLTGSLVLPGQSVTSTTPAATPTTPGLAGATTNPILQKVEKGRAEISTLGDQLIKLGQDRDLAVTQSATAQQVYAKAEEALRQAQTDAVDAAASAVREAAAMPPGALDPGLAGLGDLARLQRGDGGSTEAAVRQLELAQTAAQLALDAQTLGAAKAAELTTQYDKLNTLITQKQAAQQRLEATNAPLITAADAAETVTDSRLGQSYLAGPEAGRGADPRAVQALQFALAQRGKPYVWSTEGPDTYDCSGLMWRAYKEVGVSLERVSRDQYNQTHTRVVDRYSLLPGDLLFFSYSTSWRGIHHVAMYAGNGMMVEAPRTGLNVRLVPVRWSRLFQATRVLGSVDGDTPVPDLGTPDPDTDDTAPGTTPVTTSPTGAPAPTSPTTKPTIKPPTTKPTTKPTTRPTTPTTKPTTPPTPTPTKTTPPTTTPTTGPTTTAPTPTSDPTTTAPSGGGTTSPTGSTSSGSSADASSGSPGTTSASATKSTSSSASSTESGSASASGSTSSAESK